MIKLKSPTQPQVSSYSWCIILGINLLKSVTTTANSSTQLAPNYILSYPLALYLLRHINFQFREYDWTWASSRPNPLGIGGAVLGILGFIRITQDYVYIIPNGLCLVMDSRGYCTVTYYKWSPSDPTTRISALGLTNYSYSSLSWSYGTSLTHSNRFLLGSGVLPSFPQTLPLGCARTASLDPQAIISHSFLKAVLKAVPLSNRCHAW